MSDDDLDLVAVVGDLDSAPPGAEHDMRSEVQCPSCQKMSSMNDSFCQYCGASLSGGIQVSLDSNRTAEAPREVETDDGPEPVHVFVERDYAVGMGVRFDPSYPPQLAAMLPESDFKKTVREINSIMAKAETTDLGVLLEGFFGCVTGYLTYLCIETNYAKRMRELANFVSVENERVYRPKGLVLGNPQYAGFRRLEIHSAR